MKGPCAAAVTSGSPNQNFATDSGKPQNALLQNHLRLS